jgi:hypothetical protein
VRRNNVPHSFSARAKKLPVAHVHFKLYIKTAAGVCNRRRGLQKFHQLNNKHQGHYKTLQITPL